MKLRLKPLRGQTYPSITGDVVYLEQPHQLLKHFMDDPMIKVLKEGTIITIPKSALVLPIIDTKDYEKIPDEKYKGD